MFKLGYLGLNSPAKLIAPSSDRLLIFFEKQLSDDICPTKKLHLELTFLADPKILPCVNLGDPQLTSEAYFANYILLKLLRPG